MSADEHVSIAEVKARLSEMVDRVRSEHARVVVTKHGRPEAVIMSIEDLESLEETLQLLSDPQLMAAIAEAESEAARGKLRRMTKSEAMKLTERA